MLVRSERGKWHHEYTFTLSLGELETLKAALEASKHASTYMSGNDDIGPFDAMYYEALTEYLDNPISRISGAINEVRTAGIASAEADQAESG